MPRMTVGGVVRDIEAVVLDKDGTLVNFETAWRARLAQAIRSVCESADDDGEALRETLHRALGSECDHGAILPNGPFISATLAEKAVIVATVLHLGGVDWRRAQTIARSDFLPLLTRPPLAGEIEAIGDVATRLRLFRAGGARLAVLTNDDRSPTMAALAHLGVAELIEAVVCADDDRIAAKPAPDGVLHIAKSLDVRPSRIAVIGDASSDLRAARAAGAGLTVGVLSGPSGVPDLREFADVIVEDIHAVTISA